VKRIPETLNDVEIKALLSQPNKRAMTGLRDLGMIRLMLNAGLRASEVLSITVRNIDWTSGKVTVKLKVSRTQRAYFPDLGLWTVN